MGEEQTKDESVYKLISHVTGPAKDGRSDTEGVFIH